MMKEHKNFQHFVIIGDFVPTWTIYAGQVTYSQLCGSCNENIQFANEHHYIQL